MTTPTDNCPVIHRVTVPVADVVTVDCFPGVVLSSGVARDGSSDHIDLWYSTYATTRPREVFIAGTGHPLPGGRFIGTVVTPAGLVWHVFEGNPIYRS